MAQNRTMAIKHAKARKEALKEALYRTQSESYNAYIDGRIKLNAPDPVCSTKWKWNPEQAMKPSPLLDEMAIKILRDYGMEPVTPPPSGVKCRVVVKANKKEGKCHV